MFEYCIISDIHLGSNCCLTDKLTDFLQKIKTKQLIINGDIFESLNFNKLKPKHFEILEIIRNFENVVFINGNHDGNIKNLKLLTGINFLEEYLIQSDNKKIIIMHGHYFDNFLYKRPIISKIATNTHWLLQKLNRKMSIEVKLKSKLYIDCINKVKENAITYCLDRKYDYICCGHTHYPEESEIYYNSGSWTEHNGNYLIINNGKIKLLKW